MMLAYTDSRVTRWSGQVAEEPTEPVPQSSPNYTLFLMPDTNLEYATLDHSIQPIGYHEGIPASILYQYARLSARHAKCEEIGQGSWVASVIGFDGAYGEGNTAEAACADLIEALVGWVVVKRRIGATDIPIIDDLDLNSLDRRNSGETSSVDKTA